MKQKFVYIKKITPNYSVCFSAAVLNIGKTARMNR